MTEGDNVTSIRDDRELAITTSTVEELWMTGFEIVTADDHALQISSGTMKHGTRFVEETATTSFHLTNDATLWHDGSIHNYAGGADW